MAKSGSEPAEVRCPLYALLEALCNKRAACGEFVEHLQNARVELLLAVRSLIDRRIARLREKPRGGARSRRIKVTGKE